MLDGLCLVGKARKGRVNKLSNWMEEQRAVYLYRVVSQVERGTPRESLFRELAAAAEKQAQIWAYAARAAGLQAPPRYVPDLRTRIVVALVRRFGPYALRDMLA